MVKLDLKGLHRISSKGHTYFYAWRGGPRLVGKPGSPEFMASYNDALVSRRAPAVGRFAGVVASYRGSADYKRLAESTRRNWGPWLDRIAAHFGELSTAQFDRAEKIAPVIRRWRSTFEETPRKADYALQVLSRVCAHAVDPLGLIRSNPCSGIKQLYSGSRADIIWTDDDIARFISVCSHEVSLAIQLAALSGLRAGDLVKLSWSHIQQDAIVMTTGKSRHRREAVVPLYKELHDLLESIPRRSPVVLTTSKGKPWAKDGLGNAVVRAKRLAWPEGIDLHLHDLRGTAATRFYKAGLSEREIAEIMAWEEDHVGRIIRRYVGRGAAVKELVRKLEQART